MSRARKIFDTTEAQPAHTLDRIEELLPAQPEQEGSPQRVSDDAPPALPDDDNMGDFSGIIQRLTGVRQLQYPQAQDAEVPFAQGCRPQVPPQPSPCSPRNRAGSGTKPPYPIKMPRDETRTRKPGGQMLTPRAEGGEGCQARRDCDCVRWEYWTSTLSILSANRRIFHPLPNEHDENLRGLYGEKTNSEAHGLDTWEGRPGTSRFWRIIDTDEA